MPPPKVTRNPKMRTVNDRAKRARNVLINFIEREAIAHAAHGINQPLFEGFVNLAAQVADIDIYHIGLVEVFVVPDMFSDLRTCQNTSRFTQQAFEYGKFFASQGDELSATPNLMGASIET